jgi:DNA-binding MarR family transcriptional regulator
MRIGTVMSTAKHRGVDSSPLTPEEREVWYAWKRAHEAVRTRIIADITRDTGLSDADIAVLIRIDAAGGSLRQNRLAAELGWDRTRLSHHVTRMEVRALLKRKKAGSGVEVLLCPDGQNAVDAAHPIHAAAVRWHLFNPLGADLPTVHAALEALSAERGRESP